MNSNGKTPRNGKAFVPNWITDSDLSIGAKQTYTVLLSYAWQDGETFVSQKTIATALNRSRAQTQRYLTELEKAGLIRRERRGWPAKTYYVLTSVASSEKPHSSTVASPVRPPVASSMRHGLRLNDENAKPIEEREGAVGGVVGVVDEHDTTSPNGNAGSVYSPFEAKRDEYAAAYRRKYGCDPGEVPKDAWELDQRLRGLEVEW